MKSMTRRNLVLAALAFSLSACQTPKVAHGPHSFSFDPPVKQPANPAAVKVKLSTGAQRLYVVEGNEVLLATPVTVGVRICSLDGCRRPSLRVAPQPK